MEGFKLDFKRSVCFFVNGKEVRTYRKHVAWNDIVLHCGFNKMCACINIFHYQLKCGRHVNLVYLSDFLKCLCFDLYMYCTTLSHLHLLLFYVCNSPSLYVAIFSHLNFSTCINTQPFSNKLFDSIFN